MRYLHRTLENDIARAARHFPALILTGPRRAGKTTLLRNLFPKASYTLIEDPDVIARVRSDPNGFLDSLKLPAILDEVQNVPELLGYIRTRIDRAPKSGGRWLLTGSQEAPLMQGVTESMAGRAVLFQLLPLSLAESSKVSLLRGGYPEVLAKPSLLQAWMRSYVQTYLERDVRAVTAIRDLSTFRRFLAILASRCGKILNKTDIAGPLGVSVPTITQWLSILEITGQILLIPPFYENFGKRLVKSPKLYFVDSGMACHLLGIESDRVLQNSVFLGPVFEGFVASEIAKSQANAGKPRAIYYFRDRQGLEVNFLVPAGGNRLRIIEAKATATPTPAMAVPIQRLARNISEYKIHAMVVHRTRSTPAPMKTLCPGVDALAVTELHRVLAD
jgi:predicted AAA+ superfamily ATPase